MSDLPEIDLKRVNEKLALKNAELQHLVFQLETLAEQLRDQRDALQEELNTLKAQPESDPVDEEIITGKN